MKSLSLLLLVLAGSVAPASAGNISLNAPSDAGGFFDVFINLTDVFAPPHATDLFLAYGFDVAVNPSILQFVGETPGALFTDLSNPGVTADVAGAVAPPNIFLAPGDFTEPLNLAILHFNVIGRGPTTISISSDPLNLNQGLIYLSGTDPISGSVDVTATPEPGCALLLLGGIFALAELGRRRRCT